MPRRLVTATTYLWNSTCKKKHLERLTGSQLVFFFGFFVFHVFQDSALMLMNMQLGPINIHRGANQWNRLCSSFGTERHHLKITYKEKFRLREPATSNDETKGKKIVRGSSLGGMFYELFLSATCTHVQKADRLWTIAWSAGRLILRQNFDIQCKSSTTPIN